MTHSSSLQQAINLAAQHVQRGGVVAYPTEAVYGLGCDPLNQAAVRKIYQLKQRDARQGVILLAADWGMLQRFVDFSAIPASIQAKMKQTWPGPHTWVCPVLPSVPAWLTGKFTSIAVRVSAHPLASALSLATNGAIVSTSANRFGQLPAREAIDVSRIFDNAIDYILEGSVGSETNPTEIRDALTNKLIRSA